MSTHKRTHIHTIVHRKSCLRCRLRYCGPVQSRDRCSSPAWSQPSCYIDDALSLCEASTFQLLFFFFFFYPGATRPVLDLDLWRLGLGTLHGPERHTRSIMCKYCGPGSATAKVGDSTVPHVNSDICSFNCYLTWCLQVASLGKPLCSEEKGNLMREFILTVRDGSI